MSTANVPAAGSATSTATAPATNDHTNAAEAAVVSGDQAAYKAARRAERVQATRPTAGADLPSPTSPDTASGQPDAQATSNTGRDANQSDSGSGGSDASSRQQQQPAKGAKARSEQLGAEVVELQEKLKLRRALRDELAALDGRAPGSDRQTPAAGADRAAASGATTPAAPAFPDFANYLTTHPGSTFEQWMDARDTWRDGRRAEAETAKRTSDARVAAEATRSAAWTEKLTAARAADPEFDTRLNPDTPISAPMREIVRDSDVGPELLVYLSEHQDEAQALAAAHPAVVLRKMGALEAQLRSRATSTNSGTASPKTVSDAPAPAQTSVGGRSAEPLDPVEAAVATGDVRAFRQARLRQRTAHQR